MKVKTAVFSGHSLKTYRITRACPFLVDLVYRLLTAAAKMRCIAIECNEGDTTMAITEGGEYFSVDIR